MKKLVLTTGLLALASTSQATPYTGKLDGTYKVVDGYIQTKEIGSPERPEQLGTMKIYLIRENWPSLSLTEKYQVRKILMIEGQVRGLVDPATFLTQHVAVNDDSSGVLFSNNDVLTPVSGDPFCSTGVPIKGSETVNLVRGTGEYANLEDGELHLQAEVNNCPGMTDFGINFFTPSHPDGGFLRFKSVVNEM